MQRLEVSGAVRPIYGSLGVKLLKTHVCIYVCLENISSYMFIEAQSVVVKNEDVLCPSEFCSF